jgi:hypothetical protein
MVEDAEGALNTSQQEMLNNWIGARVGLYRVTDVVIGRSLLVEDLLTRDRIPERIQAASLSRVAAVADLIVSRALPVDGAQRFSIAPMLLPSRIQSGLIDFIEKAWNNHKEMYYNADRKDFLARSGFLVNHYLLQQAQAKPDQAWAYFASAPAFGRGQNGRRGLGARRAASARGTTAR